MWVRHFLLGLIGLAGGSAVAAGTFAFLIMLGVIPRMIGKSKTARDIMWYENAIILGGILGNIYSVFLDARLPLGHPLLFLYGISAGVFVGCNAMALAEVLKTFPILSRRIKLKQGMAVLICCLAVGKTLGSLWFFLHHMSAG